MIADAAPARASSIRVDFHIDGGQNELLSKLIWRTGTPYTNARTRRDRYGRPDNTLAKIMQAAIDAFLALPEEERMCPPTRRTYALGSAQKTGRGFGPRRTSAVVSAFHNSQLEYHVKYYAWSTKAELLRYILDMWLKRHAGVHPAFWADLPRAEETQTRTKRIPPPPLMTLEEHNLQARQRRQAMVEEARRKGRGESDDGNNTNNSRDSRLH